MSIMFDARGCRIHIDGKEIGGFSRCGNADGMAIIMRLDADDAGQKALAAASVSPEQQEFTLTFKDGALRQFRAVVTSCETIEENLCAVLDIQSGSIVKNNG